MTIPERLKSRKTWAFVTPSLIVIFTAFTGVEVPDEVTNFLVQIATIGLTGIGIEDIAKAMNGYFKKNS